MLDLTAKNMGPQERTKVIKRVANLVKENKDIAKMLDGSINQKKSKHESFGRLFSPKQ